MHRACYVGMLVVAVASGAACRPKAKVNTKEGAFLPLLAQLAANPKAQKQASTKDDKQSSTFTYADSPGMKGLVMTVAKDRPAAWRIAFDSAGEKLSPYNFIPGWSPGAGPSTAPMPSEWFDIAEGPLKGSVVHLAGYIGSLGTPGNNATKAEVFSPGFFLSAAFASAEAKMAHWACESGRTGVKAIPVPTFLSQCKDAVSSKLLLPGSADFDVVGIEHEVNATSSCAYTWASSVTAKNAFGTEIGHKFTCNYTPKSGRVDVTVGGR